MTNMAITRFKFRFPAFPESNTLLS